MASEQLMSDEDQKGLILGSLASGVLSAIIGARSGHIDPMAAGLAGAGTAYGGGHKQISDIRKAAQDQRDKQRSLAVSEAAQEESARYHKQLGTESAAKGVYYRAHQAELTQLAKERAAKLQNDLAQNLITREEYRLGIAELARLHEGTPRPETEQEALSGQMPIGEPGRTPEQSELIRLAARFPSTEKTVQGLLKQRYAAEAAGTKAEVQKQLQAGGGEIKKEAAATRVEATATAAETEAKRKEREARELHESKTKLQEAKAKAAEALKKIPAAKTRTGFMADLADMKQARLEQGKGAGVSGKKLPADFPAPELEGQKRRLPDGSLVITEGGKWQPYKKSTR